MNQVQINPTKLSILSINRSKYWLFKSAILEFLHLEASKTLNDEEVDSDSDNASHHHDKEHDILSLSERLSFLSKLKRNSLYDHLSLSSTYSPKGRKKHGSVSSASSFNEKEIDNSSKFGNKDSTHGSFDPKDDDLKELDESDEEESSQPMTGKRRDVEDEVGEEPPESEVEPEGDREDHYDSQREEDRDEEEGYFFHIAFTPIECTIICSTKMMNKLFKDVLQVCQTLGYDDIKLIDEIFVNLQIDSGGNDNNRILQLTKPLSNNNISLFFLSSHFSDIVLIPSHLEEKVITILTNNNFEFNDISGSYIINNNLHHDINHEYNSDNNNEKDNSLEERILKLFKKSNIRPVIDKEIELLLTGSRSNEVTSTILKTAVNIAKNNIPDYFAITRTSFNEVSLILPKSSKTRSKLGFQSKYLIGSTQDIINPITIDLQQLPTDSTGIVAGVAGKIINGVNSFPIDYPFELNYLSMARSAILMIPKENIDLVDEILNIDYNTI